MLLFITKDSKDSKNESLFVLKAQFTRFIDLSRNINIKGLRVYIIE